MNENSFLEIISEYILDLNKYLETDKNKEAFDLLPLYTVEELKNHRFVTNNIFSSGARKYNNNDMWFLLLKNLTIIPSDSHFIGGFITTLSYRLMEDFENRSFIIKHLINIKKFYDLNSDISLPSHSRWIISSSNVLGSVLLMSKKSEEAKEVFDRALSLLSKIPHTPLFMWNLCMLHYQYGMIFVEKEEYKKAIQQFEKCFLTGKNAIDEIYHPRNNYFISMFIDCENILKLSKYSSIAINALRKNLSEGSRFSEMKLNSSMKFNGEIVINRFSELRKEEKQWHKKIETIINTKIKEQSLIVNSDEQASKLRDQAVAFEQSGDIQTALKTMQKAHEIRPNGPLIKRKLEEYKKILGEKK